MLKLKRLRKKISRAALHRLAQIFHRSVTGHDDNGDRGITFTGHSCQVKTAHRWHLNIGEQEIEVLLATQFLHCCMRIVCCNDLIASTLQSARADITYMLLVVHQEDARNDIGTDKRGRARFDDDLAHDSSRWST